MQRARPSVLSALASLSLMLGACATVLEPREDVLDPRLAGPCERVILSWPEDASRLRALMGESFEPRTTEGVGELQLNVLRCHQQRGRQPPLSFAFLSVPISADSAPLVITRMPDDGWAWLPAVIVDTGSAGVFSAMGYETVSAQIGLETDAADDDASIAAQLIFAAGRVSITASAAGEEAAYTGNQALVSTDPQYHSVFFGRETANRHDLRSVDIDLQGETPLAAVDLRQPPKGAVFDSALRLDHVYWRLPRPQAALEAGRTEEP